MRTRHVAPLLAATIGCTAGTSGIRMIQIPEPQTRAERTNYTETSHYEDVISFLNTLQARHAPLTFGTIGTTTEGRRIPYVIASRPLVSTPEEARQLHRPIVYVNANIHAGEVEGKEAILALVRDLVASPRPNVLDSIVLIAVPIYNADGNEKFASQTINRTEQNGPELVGQRPNGQGLDLNRDYIKAEAPETRASLAMFGKWNPDIYVDLHTTDGSYHGYALTYSPSLSPAVYLAPYTRDSLLPELRSRMRTRHNFEIFDYGNFDSIYEERDITDTVKRGWYTYDSRPRFGTNYYGIRGGISILSEAFSHDPFKRRVQSTYAFVREILSLAAEHAGQIMAGTRAAAVADATVAAPVAIRTELITTPYSGPITFEVLKKTGDSTRTQPGVPRGIRRTGVFRTQVMPVYDRFIPTLERPMPPAYVIDRADRAAVAILREHGIVVETATAPGQYTGERFTIDSVVTAARPFQGHRETRLIGHWNAAPVDVTAGAYLVRTNQPLGRLATFMLEPESEDGLVDWNVFDVAARPGTTFPVIRITQPLPPATPVRDAP